VRFSERLAELENGRVPFALAIVVSRRAPVSSHLGDRAIVFPDGRMEGFVGGSCSRDIVRRHGLEAMRTGTPRLLRIRPEPASDQELAADGEHVFVPMGCASEGAADIYVEPRLPARRLIVAGFTPVASVLARLGAELDFDIVRVVEEDERSDLIENGDPVVSVSALRTVLAALSAADRARTFAIVASLGHYDEATLGTLLDAEVGFVGLVASRKRAERVFGVLAQEGQSHERIATIHNPVGLDIGARSAGDVAVSILAEIVAAAPLPVVAECSAAGAEVPRVAIDPICGMEVDIEGARFQLEHAGTTYFFCCAGCRSAFSANLEGAPPVQGNA
jgi:xanthine dehydrogenase accessory factor